jgi:pyridoxal/pyridoxine/pyridoxamine kinase
MDETRVYGRVLSIQSHVVYGYVGNKVRYIVLPLLKKNKEKMCVYN